MSKKVFLAKVSDNQDPDNLHRVKVTYTNQKECVSDWIPVLSYSSGNGNGIYLLPDVDEQVLVASINDRDTSFCVLGSIWSESNTPPETLENSDADLNKDGKNSLHFVKSKSGNMIILDDTESAEKMQLIASDGKSRIEFSVPDELITIDTENDLTLNAKSNVIINAEEIEISASRQLNISTEELQIKASKDISISSDKDIAIKGSGIALN